jgi:hypothetical protein
MSHTNALWCCPDRWLGGLYLWCTTEVDRGFTLNFSFHLQHSCCRIAIACYDVSVRLTRTCGADVWFTTMELKVCNVSTHIAHHSWSARKAFVAAHGTQPTFCICVRVWDSVANAIATAHTALGNAAREVERSVMDRARDTGHSCVVRSAAGCAKTKHRHSPLHRHLHDICIAIVTA